MHFLSTFKSLRFFCSYISHEQALKPRGQHHSTGRGYTVPIFFQKWFSGFTCPAMVHYVSILFFIIINKLLMDLLKKSVSVCLLVQL